MGITEKAKLKEVFYLFLRELQDVDKEIILFWDKNMNKISRWYLEKKQDTDIIISASPRFLLEEPCRRLGIGCLVASDVDKKSGKYLSANCYGKEKAQRLERETEQIELENFYSDSLSDEPLAKLAQHAYFVKKSKIVPWEEYMAKKRRSTLFMMLYGFIES